MTGPKGAEWSGAGGRRRFLQQSAAIAAAPLITGCATTAGSSGARIVVVGGGYGGATAAKYLKLWGPPDLEVTLVEREDAFVSCPLSNLVIGGSRTLADITRPYEGMTR